MTDQTKQTKWTPRPWRLDPCGDILANRDTPADNGLICAMCEDRADDEGIANGRLIAAAPDTIADMHLIERLAGMTGGWGAPLTAEQATALLDAIHGIARAALAKAEGR